MNTESERIVFLIGSLQGGGAERVCVTLANGLSSEFKIELVVLNLNNAVFKSELIENIRLINLNVKHARNAFFAIYNYLKNSKPHKIICFNRQLSVLLVIIRAYSKLHFTIISRNIIFLSIAEKAKKDFWHGFIVNKAIKYFYPKSDFFIAQSEAMKEDLISYLNIDKNKIKVIYNPISQKFCNLSSSLNRFESQNKNYILCVGRLDMQKAFHYAINAFSVISNVFPDFSLYIVGKGVLENELKKQANDLGISDRVIFKGFHPDIIPFYLNAKVTVLTSLFEGFPNVLLESIALGIPAVAFNCPSGPSEIIINGVNGYLCKYLDEKHLTKSLAESLSKNWDPIEVSKTVSKFRLELIVKEYIKFIKMC